MDLIILFQQRKETYLGEYAPEIVFACTEYEYEEEGADELVFLDITASYEKRPFIIDTVKKVAEQIPDSSSNT